MMSLRGPYNAYTGHEPWKYEPRFTQEQVGEKTIIVAAKKNHAIFVLPLPDPSLLPKRSFLTHRSGALITKVESRDLS